MKLLLLENFKKEIEQIRKYLKYIKYVNENLKNLAGNQEYPSKMNKRIFESNAIIISLYGILENYIENCIKEYLNNFSDIVPLYNNLPEKIQENHFKLSVKLLSILREQKSKFKDLTKEKILKKLSNCVENKNNYKINTDAFIISSGNLKHKRIIELFKLLNIDMNKYLKKNKKFIDFLKKEKNIHNISNLNDDSYFEINDLVEKRNIIAHGAELEDIIYTSNSERYISFLEIYGESIFENLQECLIEQESIYLFKKIEKVLKVYGNKILAFEIENYKIKKGDILIIKNSKNRFIKKEILSIKINKICHNEIEIKSKTKITIEVDPNIKKNWTFFIKVKKY